MKLPTVDQKYRSSINLPYSYEQGEHFHQDILIMEDCYQWRWASSMQDICCWFLFRKSDEIPFKRKAWTFLFFKIKLILSVANINTADFVHYLFFFKGVFSQLSRKHSVIISACFHVTKQLTFLCAIRQKYRNNRYIYLYNYLMHFADLY